MEDEAAEFAETAGVGNDLEADARTTQNGESHEMTLEQRVRQDPDFAWEQMRKRDARISEMANVQKAYEPLDPFIRMQGGAEGLLGLATQASQIRQIPGLAELVEQSLTTGQLALPQAGQDDPDEEWIDEDTRKVRDEARSEIASLRQELQSLRQTAGAANVRSQEGHIQKNLDSALSIFEDDAELREEALDLLTSRVTQLQRMAESGDATQQKNIEQLASESGVEVLEYMLLPLMKKKFAGKSQASVGTPSSGEQAETRRYTDGRTVNPSRPGAPPIKFVPKEKVRPGTARQIFAELQRRRGRSGDL